MSRNFFFFFFCKELIDQGPKDEWVRMFITALLSWKAGNKQNIHQLKIRKTNFGAIEY